ncbi:unnamed protein product [Rotaria socialis]|uniref:Uncharacterized protein n=1 Tax=Rotaria socialis TaxID=392032 RepID=A0A820E342_9BILA|nr:unnamed protein product [Rotaria socialis]CAF3365883.1 unnamed protein product [Rotaria socialis]CAF3557103.1 unnamed protein product [Rotaria socialis]CAF4240679.1 unnamed protein product [Rotaria socialis]CAF4293128.1 unnamed protein product [Rotaria socialis]
MISILLVSPEHLIRLGFLEETVVNRHYEINFLLHVTLEKVVFLPFSYVMYKYRFLLFRNQTDRQNELNSVWWNLRIQYNGIMAHIPRNEEILQFQGITARLCLCDVYGNRYVGEKFKEMLTMGNSKSGKMF